jgi:peptidyl-prolyl cis-trans isomerase C
MKLIRLAFLIFVVAMPLSAQIAPAQVPADRVVATINGEALTSGEFEQIWSRLAPQMRENYEKAGGKMAFLDTYIKRRLLIQESLKEGFDKRPEVAMDLRVVRESALFDRYIRDVVAEQVIPESELKAYYENNADEFHRPEMVRVRHIIATPAGTPVLNTTGDNAANDAEAADKIRKLAMLFKTEGGDFADAAKKFSEDNSAPSGGELGWFARGKMVPEFEEAAFRLTRRGETSPVVKTEFGYHVIMLEARRDAGPAPFAEVRPQIRELFLRERQANIMELVGQLTNELKSSSQIAVYPENL